MQKLILRNYIGHYDYRWTLLKHNTKHQDIKKVSVHDKVILSHINPGTTFAQDIGGLQYLGIIDDLTVTDHPLDITIGTQRKYYNNVLMLNSPGLKYKSLDEIKDLIVAQSKKLSTKGKIFVGFNYQFVNMNRLTQSYFNEIDRWISLLDSSNLQLNLKVLKKIPNTNPYGDSFFIFQSTTESTL